MMSNFGTATETNIITLEAAEVLDFSVCQEFWLASQQARDRDVKFIIDMSRTNVIRDSGYAMLLMLREGVGRVQEPINIINCSLRLQKELQIHGLDQYFTFL